MARWPTGLAVLGVALLAAAAEAAAAPRPTERACLLAWNTPANAPDRARVVASGPWTRALLNAGTAFTVTWRRGAAPEQSTAQACLLTLAKPGRVQLVTGTWRRGRVVRWTFAGALAGEAPGWSNVRVLPDGRVTKIYRR